MRNLKNRIAESGRDIPVISKIEKPEAVEHIDEILKHKEAELLEV